MADDAPSIASSSSTDELRVANATKPPPPRDEQVIEPTRLGLLPLSLLALVVGCVTGFGAVVP
jgi:hypothetical protein